MNWNFSSSTKHNSRTKLFHLYICQSSPNFFFSPTAPGVPSKIRSRKHVTNAQFSFDVISGEEIIGCIPPRIFYSRRGKKGGFKVARVAISGTLDQGGVVIRLGEGNGGEEGLGHVSGAVDINGRQSATVSRYTIKFSSRLKLHFDSRSIHGFIVAVHSFLLFFICNEERKRWGGAPKWN